MHDVETQLLHHDAKRKLEAGRQLAREYSGHAGFLGAYLSGSLVAGLGSATSDVDLFLIYEDDPPSSVAVQRQADGVRVDVEMRSLGQMQRLIGQFGRYTASLADIAQLETSLPLLDQAVRFLIGRDISGAERLAKLREGMNQDELRKVLIARYDNICINLLSDVLGLLSDGEIRSALHVSRTLLLWALQAYLAGCGELYVADKWTWLKLARAGVPRESIELVWRLYDDGPEEASTVTERIRLTQALVVAALVDGWDRPAAAGWSTWASRGMGPRRTLDRLPMRLIDASYLTSSLDEHKLRLGPDGIRLWGFADGRPRELIVDQMFGHLPSGSKREQVERYLDKLLELSLLTVGDQSSTFSDRSRSNA